MLRIALAFLLVSCGSESGSSDSGTEDDASLDSSVPDAPIPETLEDAIELELSAGNLPSVAAALIVDGEVVWEGYFGWADVDAMRRPDASTLYPVASVSKMFTSVPLMRLVEESMVELDDPIEESFGFALSHPEHPESTITLRELLTHTSGVIDNWPALGQGTYTGSDPEMTLAQFAESYAWPEGELYSAESNFGAAPGAEHEYSNAGIAIAGHLAELAWGDDFRTLTRTMVFEPLALQNTGWYLADLDATHLSVPYTYNMARDSQVALEHSTYAHYPAGGLRSSVHDLSRFVRAVLGGGELDGERIFEADTVTEMLRRQVPELSNRQGLVFRYDTVGGREYVGHSGSGLGGSANVLMRPEAGSALILLSNGDAYVRARLGFEEGREAMRRILELLDAELTTLGG